MGLTILSILSPFNDWISDGIHVSKPFFLSIIRSILLRLSIFMIDLSLILMFYGYFCCSFDVVVLLVSVLFLDLRLFESIFSP